MGPAQFCRDTSPPTQDKWTAEFAGWGSVNNFYPILLAINLILSTFVGIPQLAMTLRWGRPLLDASFRYHDKYSIDDFLALRSFFLEPWQHKRSH